VTAVAEPVAVRKPRRAELPSWLLSVLLVAGAAAVSEFLTLFNNAPLIKAGVFTDALINGLVTALLAVAIVLIYRGNKLLTFAHGAIASAAGVIMFSLAGDGWSYWAVVPATIAAAAAASALLEAGVMRRFANSPRLVATIATLAGGQLFVALAFLFPQWRFGVNILSADIEDLRELPNVPVHFPNGFHKTWDHVAFTSDTIVAGVVAIVALGAVGAFLRFTTAGTAIRGASENSERVALLGISMGSLGTLVWVIAGVLAGLYTVLNEPMHSGSLATVAIGGASGVGVLLRGFAAAVIAKMERVSVAVSAAVAITILDRGIFWVTHRATTSDVALFVVICVILLVQRRNLSRVEDAAASAWSAAEEVRPVPAVLKALPTVQSAQRWAIGLGLFAVVGFPFIMSPSQIVTSTTYTIYAIVAVSLVVLVGWGGQISLGQFALVAVGASASGAFQASWHLPFPIAMVLAAFVAAGVAILLGLPALRIRGLYLAVTTLAFALVMSSYVLVPDRFAALVPPKLNRPEFAFVHFKDDRSFFYLCVAFLVLTVFGALGLRKTRTGRVLIAARDNETAVQSFGISLIRTRLATFALAGFIAGIAGALLAVQQQAVRPEQYTATQSITMFLMAIIGGLGSVAGVVTGAIYLGACTLFLKGAIGALFAVGGGVLVVLVAVPQGLGGVVFAARDAFLRRVAIREKIYVRSLLGDVRDLDSERSRAQLVPKPAPEPKYEIDSQIREAGKSQRTKGWVYG
jgi:branched-chain amino acid transport system permease protein